MTAPLANGTESHNGPVELAIRLPSNPGLIINIHLTVLKTSILLLLATSTPDASNENVAMGSFVYAMPDRYNPTQPLSTALYALPSSLDFATRMSKVLARRLKLPCYVSSSLSLANSVGGGTVEEEVEAFHAIVNAVTAQAQQQ